MKKRFTSILAAVCALAIAGLAAHAADQTTTQTTRTEHTTTQSGTETGTQGQAPNARDAQGVISSWPSQTKTAASMLIEKYGQPDGVMDRMLVWNDRTPYHKVAVFRDSQQVDVPNSHQAYIENAVNYRVPPEKVASLVQFNPALTVDLVRGTLSSQSDSEKSNILALNLADEIVTGKRSVSSARSFMRDAMEKEMAGKSSDYTERLLFTPSGETEIPADQGKHTDTTPAVGGTDQQAPLQEGVPQEAQP